MKKQIVRISIGQTSKMMALMYAACGIVHFIIGLLFLLFGKMEGLLFIGAPFLMALFGYIGIAIFSWLYNLIASRVGGIEFELADVE